MMRIVIWGVFVLVVMSGCDNAKEEGQQTVREMSGGSMVEQKEIMQQKLDRIQQQQTEQYQQLDEELSTQQ